MTAHDPVRSGEWWQAAAVLADCGRSRKRLRSRLATLGVTVTDDRLRALEKGIPPTVPESRAIARLAKLPETYFDDALAPQLRTILRAAG